MTSKAGKKRKEQSKAVESANWTDREGKARPTSERKDKGLFVLRDADDAGVTFAVDECATQLDVLYVAGLLTHAQCQAGHDFAAMMHRTRMVSEGKSCLDFTGGGYEGDAPPTHAELRDNADRAKLFMRCNGPWVWAELRRVCCDGHKPRHMPSLIAGLDMCALHWGLAT